MVFEKAQMNDMGIKDVEVQDLHSKKDDVILIDVRRPDEYTGELGHIEGAQLMTLEDEFKEKVKELDKTKPVVFVCRSGGRSTKAALYARDLGFEEIYNMKGGMIEWNEQKLPTTTD